jgi:LuxR family maltose regulon positive regulatory protein
MDIASGVPLILVSAPAGYGKSISVSQWAEQHEDLVGWLSVDERDSDLRTFLEYLLAAIHTAWPGACHTTQGLLDSSRFPPPSVVAGYLINDLDAMETRATLVLDDYHRIDQASPVHDLMTQVLEHPTPQFQWVLITRQDPPLALAKLRGSHRIHEVRLQDLRFTRFETAEFLASAADLTVSEEALSKLQHEVEGWAVGLRLVSIASRHVPDPDMFIKDLHGGWLDTQEYLLKEVLDAQPPDVRNYLLRSSIFDRFCVEILDDLCGPAIAAAERRLTARDFMEELRQSNLFTISLGHKGEWVRYHHLFRDLLRDNLQREHSPEYIVELQMQASDWFEGKGLSEEALEYALAAGDFERAARIVSCNMNSLLNQGKWYVLEQWMSRLPDAVVRENPLLLLAMAYRCYYHVDIEAIPPILDRIEALASNDDQVHQIAREVGVFRGFGALLQNDGARSLEILERVLGRAESMQRPARALADLIFGFAGQMEGQGERVTRTLVESLRVSSRLEPIREANLAQALVFLSYISVDLAGTGPLLKKGREITQAAGLKNLEPWNDYLEGLISLQRGELDTAICLLEAAADRKYFHHVQGAVDGMCALAIAYQAQGQPEKATATLGSLGSFVRGTQPNLEFLVHSCQCRLALMQGHWESAASWLQQGVASPERPMLFFFEIPRITAIRTLIAESSAPGLSEAEVRLRELAEVSEIQHNTCHLIEVLSLLCVTFSKQGRAAESLDTLERALTLARPGGFIFPFLELGPPMFELLRRIDGECADFASQILAAFDSGPLAAPAEQSMGRAGVPGVGGRFLPALAGAQPASADLTNRQLDVLDLLARRLQNKEIAVRLGISPETVKTHVSHIFNTLGVNDRRQAVSRAAELGFLGPR